MALKKLKKRLYKKGETFRERSTETELSRHDSKATPFWKEEKERKTMILPERRPPAPPRRWFWWGLGVISMLLIVIGALLYLLFGRTGFQISRAVDLTVKYPEEAASGETTTWTVSYANNNPVALESAELTFEFPSGTMPAVGEQRPQEVLRERRVLGHIPPNGTGEEVFKGVLFGEIGKVLAGKVTLEYRPENSSARFAKESTFDVAITHTKLSVSLEVPEELQEGQEVEIKLNVVSASSVLFKNLTVGVDYPEAFEFLRARPLPVENNSIWEVGDIAPGEERTISIFGKMAKSIADPQTFRARLGLRERSDDTWTVFSKTEKVIAIRAPFLFISTALEGREETVVRPGDDLTVVVFWRNNLPVSVRNVFVETRMEGDAIDLGEFSSLDGKFDGTTNTVRWVSGFTPALEFVEPGEEGRLKFRVRVKKPLQVLKNTDNDFTIRFHSRMDAPEVPQGYEGVSIGGSSMLELRVATEFDFVQQGYRFDGRIPQSGPIPPKVGEETTYTIVWSLLNSSNDMRDVTVSAALPTYVRWKGKIVPNDSDIAYDAATGRVVWNVPALSAGTGALRPPLEVAFQIGLVPSVVHVGESPELISEALAKGLDAFTSTNLQKTAPLVDTALKDDPQIRREQEKVIQ